MPILAPPYRQLAQFAGHMATCVDAGLTMEQSLETGGRFLTSGKLKQGIEAAIDVVRNGRELSAGLEMGQGSWPNFFVPMVRIGEETGRLGDALRYLERQCRLLDGPAQALQRLWMMPLAITIAGTLLQVMLTFFAGSLGGTVGILFGAAKSYALLLAAGYFMFASPFQPIVDHLRIAVPFIGPVERDLSVNQFFAAMSMLYAAAGQRVETMIQTAARTVSNSAVRLDLLRAATEIEHGKSISEAFRIPTRLTNDEISTIEAGELSGTIERSFDRIAELSGDRFRFKLELLHRNSVKLTMCFVMLALLVAVRRLI